MIQFKTAVIDKVLHLLLEGDLTGEGNAPQILDKVSDYLQKGCKNVIIDLGKVRYINSSGIGVLITILTKFRNADGEVYLVNPSEHVQKLLIITKLQAIFSIEKTIEDAMAKIKNS